MPCFIKLTYNMSLEIYIHKYTFSGDAGAVNGAGVRFRSIRIELGLVIGH